MTTPQIDPEEINYIITQLIDSYRDTGVMHDLESTRLPRHQTVVEIIRRIRSVVFPVHLEREPITEDNITGILREELAVIRDMLSEQVARCLSYRQEPGVHVTEYRERADTVVRDFVNFLPELRLRMREDVEATMRGDPAAHSHDQVAIAYPSVTALLVHRVAHFLHLEGVPMLPRVMTERAHTVTGIDINPGAKIGRFCFIDHGTGVVVGETAEIGDHVKIYQGVTLGALNLLSDASGRVTTTGKRHPTVEDNVTIYANATILGGDTVIGRNSIIGGNVWITKSIPPNTKVMYEEPSSIVREGQAPAARTTLPTEFSI